jgi:acetyltransferase-like isoleucine patch superfamily enzyme
MSKSRAIISELLIYLTNHWINSIPSHRVRIWWYTSVMKFNMGRNASILLGCTMDTRGQFSIGDESTINESCRIDNRAQVWIGNRVSISAQCIILTADHDIQSPRFEGRNRPVTIDDYAFLGTRAMILPGVNIGTGAVVAAGAVVSKDVEPFTIVAGIPAKPVGYRNKDLSYSPVYRRFLH